MKNVVRTLSESKIKALSDSSAKELAELLSDNVLKYVETYGKVERLSVNDHLLKRLLGDLMYLNEENSVLRYIDLSRVSFEGEQLIKHNLEGTNANIDPQLVKNKDLREATLRGLDMRGKDFTGVNIDRTNLEDTGAFIDIDTIKFGYIYGAKLKGCTVTNVPDMYLGREELKGANIKEGYCEESKKYIKSLFNQD